MLDEQGDHVKAHKEHRGGRPKFQAHLASTVLLLTISGLIVYTSWLRPQRELDFARTQMEPKDYFAQKTAIRTTAVQTLGILALLFGLWSTWRTIRLTEANVQISRETLTFNTETQKANSQAESHRFLTELLARGVDQLGHNDRAVQIGGIHILEEVAKESALLHWPVLEILTAYIRRVSPWQQPPERYSSATAHKQKPSAEIQAVVEVLGRRDTSRENENRRINLTYVNLRGASMKQICLQRALFTGSNLAEADLTEAHLEGADFSNSLLEFADFSKATLSEATFSGAKLRNASFNAAHLLRADLTTANLEGAYLESANLEGACLFGANCENASMWAANLNGAVLRDASFRGTDLRQAKLKHGKLGLLHFNSARLCSADLEGADLRQSDLQSADLSRANLRNALLTAAKLNFADLTDAMLEGADLRWAELIGATVTQNQLAKATVDTSKSQQD